MCLLFFCLATLTSLSFIGGCDGGFDVDTGQDNTPQHSDCTHQTYFERDFQGNGIFLDPVTLQPYEMTIDVENFEDYFGLSAKQTAEFAYYLTRAHKNLGLPHNDLVYKYLKSGHYVVVNDDEVFGQLWGDQEAAKHIGAFVNFSRRHCYEIPRGAVWSSVIRAQYWNLRGSNVIVHEMIHMVSSATFGDSDSDHKNPLLWDFLDKQKSLMAETFREYERDHGNVLPYN